MNRHSTIDAPNQLSLSDNELIMIADALDVLSPDDSESQETLAHLAEYIADKRNARGIL